MDIFQFLSSEEAPTASQCGVRIFVYPKNSSGGTLCVGSMVIIAYVNVDEFRSADAAAAVDSEPIFCTINHHCDYCQYA